MEAIYGFDSGQRKRTIAENHKIAEALKEDKGFVYEVRLFYNQDGIFMILLTRFPGPLWREWQAKRDLQQPYHPEGGK